ncbi:MAG: DUF433 domain-containing protein [Runella slithyformis]|jgi:uncharacterized protein (DUF433 family)|nr:MAG: DUF433 domain-containing protein [Runella slithyformis]TAF97884.1 MAG: DUF433 domain-containing protein [Runella sp.]TAG22020.1 MAG: DUF433 domain-containing protein [Cytophagales bacterium]TAG38959.1 MAG: DUF433 domain-containing protein [Cytophagia bacterium]TAE93569.1 MAG: DUF433 domain-containing protein [Runella slithyformis]
MNQQHIIEVNAEILGGTPVFKGTRVAIKTLFDYLEVSSLDDFLEGYPTVNRVQAEAVIDLASSLLNTFTRHYETAA